MNIFQIIGRIVFYKIDTFCQSADVKFIGTFVPAASGVLAPFKGIPILGFLGTSFALLGGSFSGVKNSLELSGVVKNIAKAKKNVQVKKECGRLACHH